MFASAESPLVGEPPAEKPLAEQGFAECLPSIPLRGRIHVRGGVLTAIESRWLPGLASTMQIWFDSRTRQSRTDHCYLDYRASRRVPGYLTLEYIRCRPGTSYASFRESLRVLDAIAHQRQALAIFAHVGTTRISDRLLKRFGWQQHAAKLGGRQWIKRFYHHHSPLGLASHSTLGNY